MSTYIGHKEGFFMDQNQMLLYIMVGGCGLCVLYGILKRPSYLLVLLARGGFCSALVFFIHIYCQKNGIHAPVDLNIASIGTGALLGLPGVVVLYVLGCIV